jgi:hypothetical protein
MQFQKKYNLRRRKVSTEPQQINPIGEPRAYAPSTSQPKKDKPTKDVTEEGNSKEEVPRKSLETSRETGAKEVEKVSPTFKFENEMPKIKIYIPFNDLIKKGEYQDQIIKMLKM